MKLTAGQVKKVAQLANLPLTEDEEEKYSEQISGILEYMEQLEKVPTGKISSTFNTTGLENSLSGDKLNISITQEQALSNGKNISDGQFITKGVFDE